MLEHFNVTLHTNRFLVLDLSIDMSRTTLAKMKLVELPKREWVKRDVALDDEPK